MDYQHGIWLETLHLSTLALELKEKIYFSENNLFLGLKGALKLVMVNANLEFREKDFMEIIERFENHWEIDICLKLIDLVSLWLFEIEYLLEVSLFDLFEFMIQNPK